NLAAGFLRLAFRTQIFVIGQVTGRLLRFALHLFGLTLHFVFIPHGYILRLRRVHKAYPLFTWIKRCFWTFSSWPVIRTDTCRRRGFPFHRACSMFPFAVAPGLGGATFLEINGVLNSSPTSNGEHGTGTRNHRLSGGRSFVRTPARARPPYG